MRHRRDPSAAERHAAPWMQPEVQVTRCPLIPVACRSRRAARLADEGLDRRWRGAVGVGHGTRRSKAERLPHGP